MPNPNAIVAKVVRIEPPLDRPAAELLRGSERGFEIEFADAARARLDPADPRSPGFAEILDALRQRDRPAYVEVDPSSGAITRLLIPQLTWVVHTGPQAADGIEVELAYSHARHLLKRDHPDFDALAEALRTAQAKRLRVILVEDDAHRILEVRFMPGPDDGPVPGLPFPERLRWIDRLRYWPWWPWRWFGCVSLSKAQQMFDLASATSCNPLTVPPPCIPFLYPDDGCWARAHEMCRLMIDAGVKPRKLWIVGSLHVSSKNHPNCSVWWGWHVAPTLCVRTWRWWWFGRRMVIDPALFTGPVSAATWKGVQGDPAAALYPHDASVYYRWSASNLETDPSYSKTWAYLEDYRNYLKNRSLQLGPPPYANCP